MSLNGITSAKRSWSCAANERVDSVDCEARDGHVGHIAEHRVIVPKRDTSVAQAQRRRRPPRGLVDRMVAVVVIVVVSMTLVMAVSVPVNGHFFRIM